MQDLLSVIVPVYNTDKYIGKCIDSILNQTYRNLEIIIINDGSTDNSSKLCQLYAKRDNRIRLIEQANKGVAIARKIAVQSAAGKYITFVDSDDFIDNDIYEKLMPYTKIAEIVTSGYYQENDTYYDLLESGLYDTKDKMEYLYENMIFIKNSVKRGLVPFIVNKIFLTDMAKRIFREASENVFIGEDSEFLYRYMLNCNSCYITNECGYHYVMNESSIVHSVNENFLNSVSNLYQSMKKTFMKSPYQEILMLQLGDWIQSLLYRTYVVMGFRKYDEKLSYIIPFIETVSNKSVILYGAGKVGKSYWELFRNMQELENIIWVDKVWEKCQLQGMPVHPVEKIMEVTYDYILLAVAKDELANEIKEELLSMGVQKEKILWKKPISAFLS